MNEPIPTIADHPDALRYEAHLDSLLAGFIDYQWRGDRQVLLHTEVLPAFEGRGIGAALARFVFEDAIASRRRLTVKCPFLRTYLERHPEYRVSTMPPGQPPRP